MIHESLGVLTWFPSIQTGLHEAPFAEGTMKGNTRVIECVMGVHSMIFRVAFPSRSDHCVPVFTNPFEVVHQSFGLGEWKKVP